MAMAELADPARRPASLRHVEHVMGTAVSFHVRDEASASVLQPALRHLHDIDARFSTYRPDSEISRLAHGVIGLRDCSADVRVVLALAEALRLRTRGYFDVMNPGADGALRLDPSGVVKGWAVDGAAALLAGAGARCFCINAGGDVVTRSDDPAQTWRVGIRHPLDAARVFAVVEGTNLCIATSGAYERGAHIVDPHTHRPPTGVLSVTVVGSTAGSSLATVDAFATAAFAMGLAGISWIAGLPDYGVCAVNEDLHAFYDEAFRQRRVA